MNEKFLTDQAEKYQFDESELRSALEHERTTPAPWMFGSSHNNKDKEKLWEDFVELEESAQLVLLEQNANSGCGNKGHNGSPKNGAKYRVDRRTRQLLCPHLHSELFKTVVGEVSHFCTDPARARMELRLPHVGGCSLDRKVAHRICAWHGLESSTRPADLAKDPTDTVIAVKKPDGLPNLMMPPPVPLTVAITASSPLLSRQGMGVRGD